MEPYFDRVRANRKGQSGLVGIQLLNIAQQEDGSVFLGKSLDAAPHHLARVAMLENCLGGVGPGYRIIDPLAPMIEARQQCFYRLLTPAAPGSQLHERRVHDNAMKPCRKHRVAIEFVERAKCGSERLLDGILSVVFVAQKSARSSQHSATISLNHQAEGVLVTGA